MTIQVHLGTQDLLSRYLSVFVVDDRGHNDRWLLTNDGQQTWTRVDEKSTAVLAPTLQLPIEAGQVLLQSLIRHYDGGEDTRSLRRDYDAERARVDQFIAHLTKASAS